MLLSIVLHFIQRRWPVNIAHVHLNVWGLHRLEASSFSPQVRCSGSEFRDQCSSGLQGLGFGLKAAGKKHNMTNRTRSWLIYIYMQIYLCMYIHTYIHTYIYTHIHREGEREKQKSSCKGILFVTTLHELSNPLKTLHPLQRTLVPTPAKESKINGPLL